jgi:hypothetical protein
MAHYSNFRRRYNTYNPVLTGEDVSASTVKREIGIVYLALGEEHMGLTVLSISFLRRFGYSGPIRVITDRGGWNVGDLDFEVLNPTSVGTLYASRYYKTQINKHGFPTTLFLDTDMLCISPIDRIWHNLQSAELCMSLELPRVSNFIDYYWKRWEWMRPELTYMYQSGLAGHRFYNSGLILFRQSAVTDRLFDTWHEEWKRFGGQDQCALVRALARTGIKPHVLPARWNCPPTLFRSIEEAQSLGIRILHFFSGTQRLRLPEFIQQFQHALGGRSPDGRSDHNEKHVAVKR